MKKLLRRVVVNKLAYKPNYKQQQFQGRTVDSKSTDALYSMSGRINLDYRNVRESMTKYYDPRNNIFVEKAELPINPDGIVPCSPIITDQDNLILQQDPNFQQTALSIYKKHLERIATKDLLVYLNYDQNRQMIDDYELNYLINCQLKLDSIKGPVQLLDHQEEFERRNLKQEVKVLQVQNLIGIYGNRGNNLNTQHYDIEKEEDTNGIINFVAQFDYSLESLRKRYKQILLRVLVEITSPLILDCQQGELGENSFTHHLILENQLRVPPLMAFYSYYDRFDMIPHYELMDWRIVDLDYMMKGNMLLYNEKNAVNVFRETNLMTIIRSHNAESYHVLLEQLKNQDKEKEEYEQLMLSQYGEIRDLTNTHVNPDNTIDFDEKEYGNFEYENEQYLQQIEKYATEQDLQKYKEDQQANEQQSEGQDVKQQARQSTFKYQVEQKKQGNQQKENN